jgi:hypothetical protein
MPIGMRATVRIDVHETEMARWPYLEGTREVLERVVDEIADIGRPQAPHRTGAGAASIQGRTYMTAAGWIGTASWDVPHYYMGFHEKRHPFLRPAMQAVRFV